jgi:hypothetical protein
MPARNLYVRDQDEPVWAQADRLAKIAKMSLSQLATIGLRQLMPDPRDILIHVVDPEHPEDFATHEDGRHILEWTARDREHRTSGWRLSENHPSPNDEFRFGDPWSPPLEWARETLARWRQDRLELDSEDQSFQDITVEVGDRNDNRWEEVFSGRWLIEPEDQNRFGSDAGAAYGIALTARGKIAVYVYHVNDRWSPSLRVFDSLDEVDLAKEALAIAAAAMGQRRVIRRDI